MPLFTKEMYMAGVSESAGVGHIVTTVTATDQDLGYNGRIMYEITDGDDGGKSNSGMSIVCFT